MKQKLKMFYECMKPNIALMMITILVVSLLSVGMVQETKAADLGGRTNWLDADNVKGKVFEEKGVTTQDSYTEYVLKDGEYVPNTVSINSAAELGSRENPYAIESEEDLILFGQLSGKEYPEKYFLLTKKEYDMQGDKKYMIPLFPGVVAPSMPPDTGFQGNLIGNQAIIKNAYIVNKVKNTTYYAGLFSSLCGDAAIWDLNLENAIYQVEHNSSCKIGGLVGEYPSIYTFRIMNCNLSYTVNYLSPYPMYFYGLCGGYPNAYNCNVILKDINSNAALTIQAVAKMYSNTIQNCTSTITKDGFGFTISENTLTESPSFQLSTEETTYATIDIPSSGYIYREGNKIYAPGNQLVLNRNGDFEFHDETKEIKINDVACDAAATYNTVQLDYNDETTDTVIYPAGETYTLPVPEKEGCEFLGWTSKDLEEPTKNIVVPEDFVGACTYTANYRCSIDKETCHITFNNGSIYTYTGKELKPVVLVEYEGNLLVQDEDFKVSYTNNVNAATMDSENAPTAVVEGMGNYFGRKTLTFTIEKATPIVHTLPTASKIQEGQTLASSTLSGGIVVSDETVSDNDISCMEGTFRWKDDTIVPTVSDNGVTKYTVVFEPKEAVHYHSIEMEVPVVVEKTLIDLNDCDITFNNGSTYTYAGKELKPVVLVEYKGVPLVQDADFEVSYSNNVNAATMDSANAPTVVVKGIGNFVGSKTLTFTIEKATPLIQTMPTASKIQEGDSLSASTLTGGVAVSGITTNDIYGSSVELVEGTFSWKDNTFVPTLLDSGVTKYTVVFTPEDTDNYNILEFDITVDVEKKPLINIETCSISFINENIYIYNGQKIAPKIVIKNGDKILEKGKDYKVSYMNNIDAATMDSSNAPTVFVEGMGDYTGSTSLTFTIEKAIPVIEVAPTASKIQEGEALSASTLTGGVALGAYDVSGNGLNSLNGTFSWKDSTIVPSLADSGVTKYTMVFTPLDKTNYESVETVVTVVVEKKPLINLESCNISLNDGNIYTYTGNEIKPVVLVNQEGVLLEEGKDFKVSYSNNVNVATKDSTNAPTAMVEGIGEYTGSKSLTFAIEKATPLIQTAPTASKIQEGEALAASTLTGGIALSGIPTNHINGSNIGIPINGTFRWKDDTIVPTLADSGVTKYDVVFTPEDTNNYNTFEFGITVDVEKKPLINMETCSISFENKDFYIYDGQKIEPKILIKNGDKILKEGKDYKVSYMNNINAATMDSSNAPTVFVEGMGDYTGSTSLTFTIEKATPVIKVAPTASKIQEGETLSASTLTGGVVSGGIVTNDISSNSIFLPFITGTFSWKDNTVIPTLADSGVTKYTVVFTPLDTTNYNKVEGYTVVIIEKKSSTDQPGTGNVNPENPGSQKPGAGDSGTDKPATQPQVDEKITDTKNNATYKVTSSEKDVIEVAYVAPTKETKNVTIPETVTLKDNSVAKVTSIEAGAFKKNTTLQTITISKNVKTIGNEAFSGCKNLKKVKGVKSVTKIGKNAFANCKKLKNVTLGSKVTTIGEKAFYKCTALKKITIPKNVNSIGKGAFEECKNLKTVNIKTTKLTKKNVKKNAFKGTHNKAKFDVPNSKKKAYTSILKIRGVSKKATIK